MERHRRATPGDPSCVCSPACSRPCSCPRSACRWASRWPARPRGGGADARGAAHRRRHLLAELPQGHGHPQPAQPGQPAAAHVGQLRRDRPHQRAGLVPEPVPGPARGLGEGTRRVDRGLLDDDLPDGGAALGVRRDRAVVGRDPCRAAAQRRLPAGDVQRGVDADRRARRAVRVGRRRALPDAPLVAGRAGEPAGGARRGPGLPGPGLRGRLLLLRQRLACGRRLVAQAGLCGLGAGRPGVERAGRRVPAVLGAVVLRRTGAAGPVGAGRAGPRRHLPAAARPGRRAAPADRAGRDHAAPGRRRLGGHRAAAGDADAAAVRDRTVRPAHRAGAAGPAAQPRRSRSPGWPPTSS